MRRQAYLLCGFVLLVGLATQLFAPVAHASTPDDLKSFILGTEYYKPGADTVPCAGGSTTLSGNDNAQKVWNYLIGKGLSPVQTAGIMGNLQAESGFDPSKNEYGNGIGYGLAQWSFGRRSNLEKTAQERGVPVSDLGFQLDYLWSELQGPYKKTVLDPLMQTDDLTEATRIVLVYYEAPKNKDSAEKLQERLNLSQPILDKFGGGAASSGGSTAPSASGCGLPAGQADVIQKVSFDNGRTITPTAIVLHWWGGTGGIDSLISTLQTRNLSVQIGTTADGKVYQLMPQLNSFGEHAKCANSWAIGNEIEGGASFGPDPGGSGQQVALDLAGNDIQFQAVVKITGQLMKQFNIPLDGDIAPDGSSGTGVHSHKEVDKFCATPSGKQDVDDVYLKRVKDELRKQGFQ